MMNIVKTLGYIIYAIGIVGGCEGVVKRSVSISLVAICVMIVGSVFLGWEKKK